LIPTSGIESTAMLLLILSDVQVCVVDSETGKPISGAYVRGKKDWNITDKGGCTTLKYREDTVIVVRIGYRSVKSAYSDTIRLRPSPVQLKDVEVVAVKISAVEHLPFQVEVESGGEESGVFGPNLTSPEVSTAAYGSEYAKPVFRAFSVKRLTVLRDGFEVRDLSHGADHPLHLYGADVGSLVLIKGSAGAVFGGGFGGMIYVKGKEAEFSKVFHRVSLQFSLGLRYDVRSWGIPEEKATSHSTHYETSFLLGGTGLNYQNTLQVEMCGGDTITSIRREVVQGKYDFTLQRYSGVVRITYDRMKGGKVGETSR